MGYLRKECEGCAYWKKLGQHCGAIMHGMKCIAGPLPEGEPETWGWVKAEALVGPHKATSDAAPFDTSPPVRFSADQMFDEAIACAEKGQARMADYESRMHKAKDTQVAGDHYKKMGVEPWDVVDTWPLEQRIGAYRHGALKYLMRMGSKDQSAQEIAKGKHYMEKLLEVLSENGS